MLQRKIVMTLAAALFYALFSSPASASLIGDTVGVTLSNNFGASMVTFNPVVGDPSSEFALDVAGGPNDIDINFTGNAVRFTALTSAGGSNVLFAHFTLSSLDFLDGIGGFTVTGFLRSDVGTNVSILNAQTVQVNFVGTGTGFGWVSGNSVNIEFSSVPEPSTIALIAMALLSLFGLGMMRRRTET